MTSERPDVPADPELERLTVRMFALVCEALAAATHALLTGEVDVARMVVDRDAVIDDLAEQAEALVWDRIERDPPTPARLRRHIVTLLVLPEIERSADLAEHIAQRALTGLGEQMTPLCRGIVQQMSTVGLDMWRTVADAYRDGTAQAVALDEADEEIDILHERLSTEVATGAMTAAVAAQVTLLARFYERLGDHAVNLSRRFVRP